ncbi:MAG: hypothetical protein DBX47_05220 [Clostridiales bacterium]|nr:MAG: hypothetical protein DBX47_05220 [Clostridiales bacterium]
MHNIFIKQRLFVKLKAKKQENDYINKRQQVLYVMIVLYKSKKYIKNIIKVFISSARKGELVQF